MINSRKNKNEVPYQHHSKWLKEIFLREQG